MGCDDMKMDEQAKAGGPEQGEQTPPQAGLPAAPNEGQSPAHGAPQAGTRDHPSAESKGKDSKDREIERLKQAQDRYLRTLAEFENTKKRLHREKEEFVRFASETMVRELLPIVDSLDQALVAVDPSTPLHPGAGCGVAQDSAPQATQEGTVETPVGLHKQADIQAIIKGIQLIHRQLLGVLEKEGVKRISTVGEPFDPHKHEAVAQVESSDGTAEETVVEEVQVGYTMHGKVIRPAMVKIAKRTSDQKSEVRRQRTEDRR